MQTESVTSDTFSGVRRLITSNMAVTWDNIEKPGQTGGGWDYDEPNLDYDSDADPDSNLTVYYNNLGEAPTFTNISKT